jgi:heme/copper-type cytochrome/quinol oxidase subunit 2
MLRVLAVMGVLALIAFGIFIYAVWDAVREERRHPGPPVDEATAEANWCHLQLAIRWIERTMEFDAYTPTLTERQREEGRRLVDSFYPANNKEQP